MGAQPSILALQRAAGNGAVASLLRSRPVLQRYIDGTASAASAAQLVEAQDRLAGGNFYDRGNPANQQITGIDPTANHPSGGQPMRVSEDGLMAVEKLTADRQSKVFFADAAVIAASNTLLLAKGSAYMLVAEAGNTITVPDEQGGPHTLQRVIPANNPHAGNPVGVLTGVVSTVGTAGGTGMTVPKDCIMVAEAIMNKKVNDVDGAALLRGLGVTNRTLMWEDDLIWVILDRKQLIGSPSRPTDTKNRLKLAKAYGTFQRNHPKDALKIARALGVNEAADPHVGEAFSTVATGVDNLHNNQTTDWVNNPGAGPQKLTSQDPTNAISHMRRNQWGNHIGGVVAESAGNKVTLENYDRTHEHGAASVNEPVYYFDMYGPVTKRAQTWHHRWAKGATAVPNAVTMVEH